MYYIFRYVHELVIKQWIYDVWVKVEWAVATTNLVFVAIVMGQKLTA